MMVEEPRKVREIGSPLQLICLALGDLAWGSLYLRDKRLLRLLPMVAAEDRRRGVRLCSRPTSGECLPQLESAGGTQPERVGGEPIL
jgi:hypothetical protein